MHQRVKDICGKIKFMSGAQLKTIAILSMLADHVNKALINRQFLQYELE